MILTLEPVGHMRVEDDATDVAGLALPYGGGGVDHKSVADALSRGGSGIEDHPWAPSFTIARLLAGSAFDDVRAARDANQTDLASELVALGYAGETKVAEAIAAALGLPFKRIEDDGCPVDPTGAGSSRLLHVANPSLAIETFIAPRLEDLDKVLGFLAARADLRPRLRVTTRADIAAARARACLKERSQDARLSLSKDQPQHSARRTVDGAQGFAAGLLVCALLAAFCLLPSASRILHLILLPLYGACVALRLLAAAAPPQASRGPVCHPFDGAAAMGAAPAYTVLVALHREEPDCVEALARALEDIRWPRSKLQILLVCEAGDAGTIAACEDAARHRPGFDVIRTPASFPQTKPKALNFALPLATGQFIALYDAEDRPHPDQLMAAAAAFRAGPCELACVQAPLVISNATRHWMTEHFAIEYSVLFKGLLPWLAERRMPLPLGGTSNHFRADALRAVGGWDSHNVAEDADLGIRFARFGYRTDTIEPPTFEDAPERWIDWRNQRTRWMKGWCQSWLVHMRHPRRLLEELGPRDFLVFQCLFAGMIVSSLAHSVLPLFVAAEIWFWTGGAPGGLDAGLLALDVAILGLGYGGYLALALQTHRDRRAVIRRAASLPVYWTLIGLATLRAVWQLARAPQLWEKTPHGRAARVVASPGGTGARASVLRLGRPVAG